MMRIFYAASVYDIASSTKLTNYSQFILLMGAFLWQTVASGYFFLHHFQAQLAVSGAQICAYYFKAWNEVASKFTVI